MRIVYDGETAGKGGQVTEFPERHSAEYHLLGGTQEGSQSDGTVCQIPSSKARSYEKVMYWECQVMVDQLIYRCSLWDLSSSVLCAFLSWLV